MAYGVGRVCASESGGSQGRGGRRVGVTGSRMVVVGSKGHFKLRQLWPPVYLNWQKWADLVKDLADGGKSRHKGFSLGLNPWGQHCFQLLKLFEREVAMERSDSGATTPPSMTQIKAFFLSFFFSEEQGNLPASWPTSHILEDNLDPQIGLKPR
ncbi:hypothetical protein B0H13DRAFT_1895068 [Mycena leptocephala]|nr:hypothetical protein B0H13DRAFT_1895068 [Mycena leptocephala]